MPFIQFSVSSRGSHHLLENNYKEKLLRKRQNNSRDSQRTFLWKQHLDKGMETNSAEQSCAGWRRMGEQGLTGDKLYKALETSINPSILCDYQRSWKYCKRFKKEHRKIRWESSLHFCTTCSYSDPSSASQKTTWIQRLWARNGKVPGKQVLFPDFK